MKKVVLTILFAASTLVAANAQSNAIGLRFGAGDGTSVEASYQRDLSDENRLEVDLGLNFDEVFCVAGVYQWVWDLSALSDGFKWYAGPGAGAYFFNGGAGIGIVGNVGIEYNFNIPLQLSLDFRPGWYFFDGYNDFGWGGVGLAARYKF